jgi:hypothetical protein
MKTAMQELIEHLNEQFTKHKVSLVIEVKYFLDKEKVQTIRDFKSGCKSEPFLCEAYYNKTYNQNK